MTGKLRIYNSVAPLHTDNKQLENRKKTITFQQQQEEQIIKYLWNFRDSKNT